MRPLVPPPGVHVACIRLVPRPAVEVEGGIGHRRRFPFGPPAALPCALCTLAHNNARSSPAWRTRGQGSGEARGLSGGGLGSSGGSASRSLGGDGLCGGRRKKPVTRFVHAPPPPPLLMPRPPPSLPCTRRAACPRPEGRGGTRVSSGLASFLTRDWMDALHPRPPRSQSISPTPHPTQTHSLPLPLHHV